MEYNARYQVWDKYMSNIPHLSHIVFMFPVEKIIFKYHNLNVSHVLALVLSDHLIFDCWCWLAFLIAMLPQLF